jgi:hypothetical protein
MVFAWHHPLSQFVGRSTDASSIAHFARPVIGPGMEIRLVPGDEGALAPGTGGGKREEKAPASQLLTLPQVLAVFPGEKCILTLSLSCGPVISKPAGG